ncbi:interferon gamma-like [Centroberyx affinis]|uniref:interferon gamma-like n=1 Tax=Centroberyx affinis TaxID=166261 RepID=UPI003A5C4217
MARAVICLSVCLSVCLVSSSHIPEKMNKTIHNLLQHYKIPDKERYNGTPVFSKDLLTGKMDDWGKRVFVSEVLEVYDNLIGRMLSQLPSAGSGEAEDCSDSQSSESQVKGQLCYLLNLVRNLRKHQYKNQDQDRNQLVQGLESLGNIQTDNAVVQSKALWELKWLYQEGSSLAEKRMQRRRRRRRRQAQRVKTPLSG